MKNRIICVVACMMMLAGCLGLCSCGNYRVFDTTFTYSWAQIKLPDGTIVQGKVDNWTDYEGDQLQITIDGTTYLVHAANANLSGKGCGDKKCSKERMIFSLS